MIEKRRGAAEGTLGVTFRIPTEVGGSSAAVAGEFNAWSETATCGRNESTGLASPMGLPPAP